MKVKLTGIVIMISNTAFAGGAYSDGVEYIYGTALGLLVLILLWKKLIQGLKELLIKGFQWYIFSIFWVSDKIFKSDFQEIKFS